MFKYRIYGLNVLSDRQLDCYAHDFEKEDLRLKFSQDEAEADRWAYKLCDDEKPMEIKVRNFGKFSICGTENIVIYYCSDYILRCYLVHYLLGFIFSLILMKRKIFFLHGSSIVCNGSAIVIVGESKAGKSTLAAGFAKCGCMILSDDLTRIDLKATEPFVYPSFPSRKLWKSAIEKLEIDTLNATEIYGTKEKFSIAEAKRDIFINQNVPVRGIVFIQPFETPDIRLIKEDTNNSLVIISKNIYNKRSVRYFDLKPDWLEYILAICDKIPVYSLYRPKDGFKINEQADAIIMGIYKKDI